MSKFDQNMINIGQKSPMRIANFDQNDQILPKNDQFLPKNDQFWRKMISFDQKISNVDQF